MNQKFGKATLFLTLVSLAISLSVDSSTLLVILDDLLSGEGLFNTQSLGAFSQDSHHTTTFLTVNSSNVLK